MRSNLKLSITEIMEAFPDECKTIIPGANRRLKRSLKPYKNHIERILYKYQDRFTQKFMIDIIKLEYKPEITEKQIKRNDMIITELLTPNSNGRVTDAQIQDAKHVPLAKLYNFTGIRTGNLKFSAICPFHKEKTGSFFVYPDNHFHCFGCGVTGDSISFIQKLHGLSFKSSIKNLLNV